MCVVTTQQKRLVTSVCVLCVKGQREYGHAAVESLDQTRMDQ